jgi:pathogenesis-related protein 1
MVGMTAAHNVVRDRIMSPKPQPALPPLKWSAEIAKIAQAYAEKLAAGGDCLNLVHSRMAGLGENLAGYQGLMAKPADVVEGWASEEECYTFGPISDRGEDCDTACAMRKSSSSCGHYTQVVWRGTTEVGCGMATCGSGRSAGEVWVCNYKAPGNFIGMEPY